MTPPSSSGFFTDLRASLLFLTILPAGRDAVYSPMGMIRFFRWWDLFWARFWC